MTLNVSPGSNFNEFDLTQTVTGTAVLPACQSGIMRWGPMWQTVLLGSQNDLLNRFFQPSNLNGETWYNLWSYLAYGSQAYFVRAGDVTGQTIARVYANSGQAYLAGNTVVLLDNTEFLTVGMKLFYSNDSVSSLTPTQEGGVYIEAVNSTSIILSSAPSVNVGNVEVIFRNNVFYNAVGQEYVALDLQWADYNVPNANVYNQLVGTFDQSIKYLSRYPGLLGNSIRVSQCDNAAEYNSSFNLQPNGSYNSAISTISTVVGQSNVTVTISPANTANSTAVAAANALIVNAAATLAVGDLIQVGNSYIGFQYMQVTNTGATAIENNANVFSFVVQCENPYTLIVNNSVNSINRYWEFYNLVGVAPGQSTYQDNFGNSAASDQLHVVVVDNNGDFTGNPGQVLEVYKNVSRAIDNQNPNGTTNYYANVINQSSRYIWFANDRTTAKSANSAQLASSTATDVLNLPFQYGDDGLGEGAVSIATIANGYSYFASPSTVQIRSVMVGKGLGIPLNGNTQLASYLINNLSEVCRDCVVFASPDIADVVNNAGNEAAAIVAHRNTMPSSSYGFMDSGYKYVYDLYNNLYRWCPLNGDMAGIEALTCQTNGPWWSPGGFRRGNVKNVVQLAWNPEEPTATFYTQQVSTLLWRSLREVLFYMVTRPCTLKLRPSTESTSVNCSSILNKPSLMLRKTSCLSLTMHSPGHSSFLSCSHSYNRFRLNAV